MFEDFPGCDRRMNRRNQAEFAAALADRDVHGENPLDQLGSGIALSTFLLSFIPPFIPSVHSVPFSPFLARRGPLDYSCAPKKTCGG
jgi:hypothetical protein